MRRRGVPCVRWNLDQFPIGSVLTYRNSGDGFQAEIATDGRKINLECVGTIWCRGVQAYGFPSDLVGADRKFAEAETERMLTALYTLMAVRSVTHPHRHVRPHPHHA